jgi:outer membrane murein-binding lipoprotein Lpp
MTTNIRQFPSIGDKSGGPGNTGSGNPPGGDQMEARVAKLESHVEYMRRDISDLRSDVRAMAADVVSLKIASSSAGTKLDHIDKHMITKGQLSVYALLTLLPIIGGGWWIVQQYLAPLLKALPH